MSRRGIIVIVESLIVDIEYTDVMGKAKIIFHYPRTLVLVLSCTIKAARGEGGVDSVDSVESRRDQHQQAAAKARSSFDVLCSIENLQSWEIVK